MGVHSARGIAGPALVVGGLVASSAWADPPPPTPTSAILVGSTYASLISSEPSPLRFHVSSAGVEIEAFELAPGPHQVTVEYEESGKSKVAGFKSSDTQTPALEGSRRRSRCVLEFGFEADHLYRVVRSGIGEDGKLKRFGSDNWGVWLVGDEWDQPLAQCK